MKKSPPVPKPRHAAVCVYHKRLAAHRITHQHDEQWMTRDGQVLYVNQMDPDHVRNTLRMILRKRRFKAEKAKAPVVVRWVGFDGDNWGDYYG